MRRFVFIIPIAALTLTSCAHRNGPLPPLQTSSPLPRSGGQAVFIKNCAHCHGSDGHGDEGPDLHNLDESDSWIANRIRNGKKGQMTAFAGKLEEDQINQVIGYLRTLK